MSRQVTPHCINVNCLPFTAGMSSVHCHAIAAQWHHHRPLLHKASPHNNVTMFLRHQSYRPINTGQLSSLAGWSFAIDTRIVSIFSRSSLNTGTGPVRHQSSPVATSGRHYLHYASPPRRFAQAWLLAHHFISTPRSRLFNRIILSIRHLCHHTLV